MSQNEDISAQNKKITKTSASLFKQVMITFIAALLFLCTIIYAIFRFYYYQIPMAFFWIAFAAFVMLLLLILTLYVQVLKPLVKLTNDISCLSEADGVIQIDNNYRSAELSSAADVLNSHLAANGSKTGLLMEINAELMKYESSIKSAKDGIVIFDKDGYVEFVNDAFNESTQYDDGELVDKRTNVSELLFHFTPTEKLEEIFSFLRRNMPYFGEIKLLTKYGELSFDDITVSPVMDDNGELLFATVIKRNINDKKKYEEILEHLANHDSLTLLPNRRSFISYLTEEIAKCREKEKRAAVLFLDINDFKVINDTLGHSAGNRLLKMVAANLKNALREANCIARMGGDEFTVLLEVDDANEDLEHFVHKIFDAFSKPFVIRNRDFEVTVSIGSAVYPTDGDNSETLLRSADMAMYKAKQQGKNAYLPYYDGLQKQMTEKLELENSISEAIQNKEFIVYFQPKIETRSKRITGCEALVRWNSKTGMILPADFIPLADETGLIVPLTFFVLKEACRNNQKLVEKGHKSTLAVNIPYVFLQHKDFFAMVDEALSESGMDPCLLDLEITEDSLIHDSDYTRKILKQAKTRGVDISIDDFGTGYSSLSYLNKHPISRIKIDSSFIAGVPHDREACAIVQAVITMCRGMQLTATAEGVETIEQLQFLEEQNCDEIQGYYVGKPLPPDNYEIFMSNWNRMIEE